MNTPKINASNAGDPLGKNRGVTPRHETRRAEGTEAGQKTSGITPETETASTEVVRSAPDTFRSTGDREFVREMVAAIENEEPTVREEAVSSARNRVSEGFYNTPEFMGSLAARLINTG